MTAVRGDVRERMPVGARIVQQSRLPIPIPSPLIIEMFGFPLGTRVAFLHERPH